MSGTRGSVPGAEEPGGGDGPVTGSGTAVPVGLLTTGLAAALAGTVWAGRHRRR
ncbi:hypothetical protein [Nocardioides taihuensis]|uniref:LPXTG cell wall anchor domain-containing protein n=1 Tax=Nocardioides taihuensis TaxID=1835606 RepID=A0ABW0BQR1_9ACTN